jgi:hypothetical protein
MADRSKLMSPVDMARTGNPIFLGGVPRSGTTLLRVILDTHPSIYFGTELRVVPALAALWSSADAQPILAAAYAVDSEYLRNIFVELVLSFIKPAWQASGKARVAEKTPFNVLVFPELRQLFPDSALVHIIRDARDVVASRLEREKAAAGAASVDTVALARSLAQEWAGVMEVRRKMLADSRLSRTYFEMRYEELVNSPYEILQALFAFIGEDFDPGVLDFHRTCRNVDGTEEWSAAAVRRPIYASSCGRWRQSLREEELAAVLQVARPMLEELGYDAG